MSAAMTARLVTDALVMAIWRWGKPHALLHHSDRGSQYASELFQRFMADHGRLLDEPVGQRLETTPRWRALLVTQNRSAQRASCIARGMRPRQTCSITSSASTIRNAGTPGSVT